jgi:HlyD family secretion protein
VKRLAIPLGILISLALVAGAGWLGYTSVTWSGIGITAAPTPSAQVRTVAVTRGDVRQVLTVPGEVSSARQVSMGFSAGGKLVEVTVRAGDTITQGQTLARLDTDPLNLAVALAQASVDAKQAALDKLKAGASTSDLAAANASVKDAQTALQNAQLSLSVAQNSSAVQQTIRDREYEANWYEVNYGESLRKYDAGKIDKDRLDQDYSNLLTAKERLATARTQAALSMSQANQTVANAQETLRKAQADLATLKAGSSSVDLKQSQADLQSAQLNLKQAQVDLANAVLLAPFDGRVMSVSALTGDIVGDSATVLTVADLTQLEIKATVGQEDVTQVLSGQAANVTFDALPGETFTGSVSRVVPTRASTSGAVTYTLYVSLDKPPNGLLPGMTADADLIVAEHKNVLTLPRRSIRGRANSNVSVPVLEAGRTVTRTVKVGLIGDLNAEILSGLEEGDRVVSSQ